MAKLLRGFFERARDHGGLAMQIKLAATARMTSAQAEALPDSSENLSRLEAASRTLGIPLKPSTLFPIRPLP